MFLIQIVSLVRPQCPILKAKLLLPLIKRILLALINLELKSLLQKNFWKREDCYNEYIKFKVA